MPDSINFWLHCVEISSKFLLAMSGLSFWDGASMEGGMTPCSLPLGTEITTTRIAVITIIGAWGARKALKGVVRSAPLFDSSAYWLNSFVNFTAHRFVICLFNPKSQFDVNQSQTFLVLISRPKLLPDQPMPLPCCRSRSTPYIYKCIKAENILGHYVPRFAS